MFTRRLLAAFAALALLAPNSALAGAGDGPDKKPSGATKTDAAPAAAKSAASSAAAPATNASDSKDPNSAIETELQLLKSEVEAQRAALAAQQRHIEELEARLHPVVSAEASTETATAPATDATAASSARATSSATNAPPDQDLGMRMQKLEDRLNSVGPFSFSGDIRLRDEPFFGGPSNGSQDRNRERYRLRFNVLARLNSDLSGGFSMATGDINDPISTNQTANQDFTRKPFLLDRAFIVYNPHWFKPLTLTGGKFSYPWYNTELTWDKDLNPEGLAEKLEWHSEDWHVLRQFALVGFELPFSETSGVNFNYPDANNKSIHQSVVYGGQIQTAWQLASWLRFTADTAFYNWHLADPVALAAAQANAASPADGLLKIADNLTNSYQTVTVSYTVPTGTSSAPTGTTTVGTTIVNAQFNSKFALTDSIAQFDIKTHSDAWPVRFLGDYVQNTRACANANTPIFVPTEPTNANVKITTVNGNCNSNQRRGYWLESQVGRQEQKGDWLFGYTRIFTEQEAVLSVLDYSELRQGSNVSEHRVRVSYVPTRNVLLEFTGLFGRPLNFASANPPEDILKRLQFDLTYKF